MTKVLVYHVGDLAVDRRDDPILDCRAEEFLEKGTALGVPTRPQMGDDSPRGRGEGELSRRKLWPGVYEYRFRPFRKDT